MGIAWFFRYVQINFNYNIKLNIQDIYNRLEDGTTGEKRGDTFAEPTSGPTVGTGHTLNDIMGKAPVINANGAIPAQVLDGKFYWGLVNG